LDPAVVFEDRQILVVQKPPMWLAQADGGPRPDVLGWARRYLEVSGGKPGRAYAGLWRRLGLAVGGLMALAKTSKAAKRLGEQFRERAVGKRYLALLAGEPPPEGALDGELVRDGRLTRAAVPPEKGYRAFLGYRVLARGRLSGREASLLSVKLSTGFKHQIRAQLAGLGFPLAGDRLYGADPGPGGAIGLWAFRLELGRPVPGDRLAFVAGPGTFGPGRPGAARAGRRQAMGLKGFWGIRPVYWALRSRKANRRGLEALGAFFAQAARPEAILAHFGLEAADLGLLDALGLKEDGWWPVSALGGAATPAAFRRLLRAGFFLAKPLARRVRLSDSGRFALILCAR
jgi:23S rRNA pseudouridine1911/1915/1917 synthase